MTFASRRPGFSLIELMIAIIILGLGMVMVAMIFPVAWSRARDMSEETKQATITDTARVVADLSTRVDGSAILDQRGQYYNYSTNPPTRVNIPAEVGSFVGDLVYMKADTDHLPLYLPNKPGCGANAPVAPGDIVAYADTRVHYLHMENLSAAGPRHFVPNPATLTDGPGNYHYRDGLFGGAVWTAWPADRPDPGRLQALGRIWFGRPQVRFEERLFPKLRARDSRDFSEADDSWDEMLATRRFAWGVFHRLREQVGPEYDPSYDMCSPTTLTGQSITLFSHERAAAEAVDGPRDFDMYYVSLRRPQAAYRYARQDVEFGVPNPFDPATAVAVQAMGADDDVVLPEPWRVQILLPDVLYDGRIVDPDDPNFVPLGAPTEVRAGLLDGGDAGFSTCALVATLFQKNTPFIDEVSGQIYRVVKYRPNADMTQAYLTLDRQITVEDVDDDIEARSAGGVPLGEVTDSERLRTVWVFPPPVMIERPDPATQLFYAGDQPVIGIDVGTLTKRPAR